jgi:cytoskeletal protein CcmA (bactofilin family)
MFSKDSKPAAAPTPSPAPEPAKQQPGRSAAPSIIGPDLKIKGDLISNGDLQIDGSVEGDIVSRTVTIGEGADVRGAVSGESVRVCGSVTGQVKGTTVTLAKTAKVNGDVLHQTLSIEPGAFFEGQCRRIDSTQSGGAKSSAPTPAAAQTGTR